jgi:2'-hydroxyisoflavone reductase
MKLLVLGGTVFLGRHIVEAALTRGHEVTLFNRGRHNPHLFPAAEKLRGDRNGDVGALRGRSFDAVIDTSGYSPSQIGPVADVLGGGVNHYTFVSSISVCRRCPPGRRFDEDAPRADGDEGYGALKARAEDAIERAMPGRVTIVRPGLIVGPQDPTDRFTYWPRRVAEGGRILAPGRPDRPVQFIDVRDLAEWCVRLGESQRIGTYNAVGPATTLTMARLLDECRGVAGSDAEWVWMSDDEVLAAGVQPWTELPLWIPEGDPDFGGMQLADNRRAVEAGLVFRPLAGTIEATLRWDREEGAAAERVPIRVTPLTREREPEILAR